MNFKKTAAALLAACFIFSGCSSAASSSGAAQSQAASSTASQQGASQPAKAPAAKWAADYLPQFAAPESGTPIVTLHTSMGDIKMMLFPQAAPKTVENFVTHCQNGYYDGVIFHRVIEDFMIQGGDPLGNGKGGESIWKNSFEDEFSDNLHNFRGAVSMANAGYGTNGSQFFIVQEDAAQYPDSPYRVTKENAENIMLYILQNCEVYNGTMQLEKRRQQPGVTDAELQKFVDELNSAITSKLQMGVTDDIRKRFSAAVDKYIEVGGTPQLDYKHTVFGQVTDGMEVVDAIARVETKSGDRPAVDVVINSVTVETAA